MSDNFDHHVLFELGNMIFEYDKENNQTNIKKHGLPLSIGARVFFDEYRIELDDTGHSDFEQRYDAIDSSLAGMPFDGNEEILFVIYTERDTRTQDGVTVDVTRLISVGLANNFERGVYYANRR